MLRPGCFATVWEVKKDKWDNFVARVTVSRKDKNTGEYVTDFSDGYVRFKYEAEEKIKRLDPKAKKKIKVLDFGVTRKKADDGNFYTTVYIYDFDTDGDSTNRNTKSYRAQQGDYDEDDLPV